MRTAITLLFVLVLAVPVYGGDLFGDDLTVRGRITDIDPDDGIMDAGSPLNPYVVDVGDERYEVRSRVTDIHPGDGILEAGSPLNPWVIERK